MTNEKDKIYKQKFMAFAIRMVKLKNYLNEQKHEYNIADQIQRSGTNLREEIIGRLTDFLQLTHFMFSYASYAKRSI